jgi:hypothetical protein
MLSSVHIACLFHVLDYNREAREHNPCGSEGRIYRYRPCDPTGERTENAIMRLTLPRQRWYQELGVSGLDADRIWRHGM